MSLTLLEAAKAKLEGKRVEYRYGASPVWVGWSGDVWHESWKFRIAPEPKKKVKVLCWYDGADLRWRNEGGAVAQTWKRVPSEDKEIEVEND